ncbi:MAG: hypothetical protein RJA22_3234, partial [Verrucomicrobiota bacterium]
MSLPNSVLRAVVCLAMALGFSVMVHGAAPRLTLDRQPGPWRVGVEGETGGSYDVEVSTNGVAGSADWSPLVTLNLTGPTEHWLDVQPGPGRFYRAV